MTDPRYPIGAFEPVGRPLSEQERNTRIDTIAMHPERAPVEPSLRILDGLHERWATLLRALDHDDFQKLMRHPEIGDVSLDFMLDL